MVNDGDITREEWVIGFSVILKGCLAEATRLGLLAGSAEEQTDYCFNIYDLNGDGFLSWEEMRALMKVQGGLNMIFYHFQNCLLRSQRRLRYIEDDSEDDLKVISAVAQMVK